jgi:competence ComEA-like helix-hairpin-helix protein
MSWLKDYFSFSKRERNAFIVVILLIVTFIFLPDFFTARKAPTATSEEIRKEVAASKVATTREADDEDEEWRTPFANPAEKKQFKLFPFDPNTLDEEGFIALGLPQRTARTIVNYRNKGGRFRKAGDLRKIYSLRKEDADRIIPFARVESAGTTPREFKNKTYSASAIDINTATAEEWKSLPGIGDILSDRIVKFRDRLGGFASIEQVAKTFGLRDSTFQLIKPFLKLASPVTNKVNINTAYESELLECAAISADVAKAIVIYRKQHGNFQTIDDLKKIVFMTDEMFQKIAPHVKVN